MTTNRPVVLVTGGRGLVGKALENIGRAKMQEDSVEFVYLSSKDGDLREEEATRRIFEKYQPKYVVHLAARVGGLFANMADNLGFFTDNLKKNMNVVECCHEFKVEHAVFCLSTCVFPAEAALPIDETSLHQGPPHHSNEGYAYAKRMLECTVRYHKETYNYTNWTCIIPTNIYGPHDNFNTTQSHVIPALIRKCVEASRAKQPFVVAGSGKPLRQFIFSEDLAQIIRALLFEEKPLESAYIACDMETELSIKDVAGTIAAAVGFKGETVMDISKADGIFRKTASNKKLKSLLSDNLKFTSFADGISQTVHWYVKNENFARK